MFKQLHDTQVQLTQHPLFGELKTLPDLQRFMESHVFAVWDFMSLLKRLQRDITCVELPWKPSKYSTTMVRLINQIVVGEESDLDETGTPVSHFELYLQAMREVGASTEKIEKFLSDMDFSALPSHAREFTRGNLDLALNGSTIDVAATFFYGREKLIPDMFTTIVGILKAQGLSCPKLMYYLERHIQVDGEEHGPLSEKCLQELCQGNEDLLQLAQAAGLRALNARDAFWTGTRASLRSDTHAAL